MDTTALYAQVATNVIRAVMSPLDRLTPLTHRRTSRRHKPQRSWLTPPFRSRIFCSSLRATGVKLNAGHVSLGQLKVMSAIESCRTVALGGHVMPLRGLCSHADRL